jgi:hypothetical protein
MKKVEVAGTKPSSYMKTASSIRAKEREAAVKAKEKPAEKKAEAKKPKKKK